MNETQRIVSLQAENFKRLSAVYIQPDGNIVQITGRNAQGKTSVLDAITVALGGKSMVCPKPVKNGQRKAVVICETEKLIVKRTFTEEGGGTLTVTTRDGVSLPSPQAVLNEMVGKLSFDPLAFTREDPKKQLEILQNLVGLDLSDLEESRARFFQQRTDVGRALKQKQGELAAIPIVNGAAEPVNVSALASGLRDANQKNREIESVQSENRRRLDAIARMQREIKEYKRQIAEIEQRIADTTIGMEKMQDQVEESDAWLKTNTPVDTSAMEQQLADADKINAQVASRRRRAAVAGEVSALTREQEDLTNSIKAIDEEKEQAMAEAKFPVKGLGFGENGVLLNGLPLEQASAAEQLKVAVAIGIASNPKLRVLLVRDGSLLDQDSMAMLAEMAEANNMQVWVERVADGEKVGIVIEDGRVAQ